MSVAKKRAALVRLVVDFEERNQGKIDDDYIEKFARFLGIAQTDLEDLIEETGGKRLFEPTQHINEYLKFQRKYKKSQKSTL